MTAAKSGKPRDDKRRQKRRRGRTSEKAAEMARPSWWERLPATRQHAVCLAALAIITLGFFAPIHFGGKTLVGDDTVRWRAMAEAQLEHKSETGEAALWAPNMFAGMPGYMIHYPNRIPQLDTALTALRRVVWPSFYFFTLAAGCYCLVVFLTRKKIAGALAGAAFGLTTYMPVLLVAGHNSKFITLSFAPWLLLAFAYATRRYQIDRSRSPLPALLFAITTALVIRAGHVQIAYYMAFILGIWWLAKGIDAAKSGNLKSFGVATAWLMLGGLLGLLMVAHPYLTWQEYKAFTIRGTGTGGEPGGLSWEYAMGWSQGPRELLTLLIADAFGGGGQTYWGPKTFTSGPHYIGGVVLALAAVAVLFVRRIAVYALTAAALLMLLFSLGEYAPLINRPMFDHFPLFSAMRVPETWLIAVVLAFVVLAAYGLKYVVGEAGGGEAEATKSKRLFMVFGGATAISALLLLLSSVVLPFEREGELEQYVQIISSQNQVSPDDPRVVQAAQQYLSEAKTDRAELFNTDATRTLIMLALATLVLVLFRRGTLPSWAFQSALVLLVVVDLWGVGRRYVNEDRLTNSRDAAAEIQTYEFDRFIRERVDEAGGPGHFRVLSLEPAGSGPFVNSRPSYHYESIGGYHGAKLRVYQDYIEHIFTDPATGAINPNALDLMNTRYVVARGALPGTQSVFTDPQTQLQVLENPDALPRAFLVGQTEVIAEAAATWDRLRDANFDPRRTTILTEPTDAPVTPVDSTSTTEVELRSYAPDRIVWSVTTDAPRLMVASEVYYPAGWNAYVDDVPTTILRADYLLRAVPVPAGEHTVEMRFEPRSHRLGVLIAGTATAVVYGSVLLLLGLAWARRHKA